MHQNQAVWDREAPTISGNSSKSVPSTGDVFKWKDCSLNMTSRMGDAQSPWILCETDNPGTDRPRSPDKVTSPAYKVEPDEPTYLPACALSSTPGTSQDRYPYPSGTYGRSRPSETTCRNPETSEQMAERSGLRKTMVPVGKISSLFTTLVFISLKRNYSVSFHL